MRGGCDDYTNVIRKYSGYIQHLIREKIEVDDATLADADTALGSLG
ncbi:MAG: hypothetical protein QOJ44_1278 [Acidimicrobiaceae bacterium]|jgi:hypothetical protein|nr:hypothetical protein [Acidimicrobiaceae bacterium]